MTAPPLDSSGERASAVAAYGPHPTTPSAMAYREAYINGWLARASRACAAKGGGDEKPLTWGVLDRYRNVVRTGKTKDLAERQAWKEQRLEDMHERSADGPYTVAPLYTNAPPAASKVRCDICMVATDDTGPCGAVAVGRFPFDGIIKPACAEHVPPAASTPDAKACPTCESEWPHLARCLDPWHDGAPRGAVTPSASGHRVSINCSCSCDACYALAAQPTPPARIVVPLKCGITGETFVNGDCPTHGANACGVAPTPPARDERREATPRQLIDWIEVECRTDGPDAERIRRWAHALYEHAVAPSDGARDARDESDNPRGGDDTCARPAERLPTDNITAPERRGSSEGESSAVGGSPRPRAGASDAREECPTCGSHDRSERWTVPHGIQEYPYCRSMWHDARADARGEGV